MLKKTGVEERIRILEELGEIFRSHQNKSNTAWWDAIQARAFHENGWFSPDQTSYALNTWTETLSPEKIRMWAERYKLESDQPKKQVGVVMAGNIPLAGLHDLLSVILTGNSFLAKPSHQDKVLVTAIFNKLFEKFPHLEADCKFTPGIVKGCDFYIATGSGNSTEAFREFFGKYPHIVRGHRNSVAILTGSETEEDLLKLGADIFTYYGLGCRSVSKLYVPEGYDHNMFFKGIFPYSEVVQNSKYGSNFDYYRATYLLNMEQLLENGFVLYKEDAGIASPPSVLFWETYNTIPEVLEKLDDAKNKIQCIAGMIQEEGILPFGQAQKPELWDYADDIDTVEQILES